MGRNFAEEISEFEMGLDQKLEIHLRYNHYPPIHLSFIETAKTAIEKAQEAIDTGDSSLWEEKIKMPNGITRSVSEIVDGLHLDSFLEGEDE